MLSNRSLKRKKKCKCKDLPGQFHLFDAEAEPKVLQFYFSRPHNSILIKIDGTITAQLLNQTDDIRRADLQIFPSSFVVNS